MYLRYSEGSYTKIPGFTIVAPSGTVAETYAVNNGFTFKSTTPNALEGICGDGVTYTVNVHRGTSPIIEGIEDFQVVSEHYYLHVDPSIEVLASTRFPLVNYYHAANKPIAMPVVWTKYWGVGRVFYCALGHHDDVFDNSPSAQVLMERGMLWASESKEYNEKNGIDASKYQNSAKMY